MKATRPTLISSALILSCLMAFSAVPSTKRQQSSANLAAADGSYIGLRHGRNLPAGLKDEGGGLITDPYKDKVQYGISHVVRGRTNMLWFELGTHHDAEGQAFWEVLDVVTLPTLKRGQLVMFTLCQFNHQPDSEIAAVVQPLRGRNYETRTIRAWRANRQTRKFKAIPTRGVKCELQGDY